MIRFGPAGNSESFYASGLKHTWQAFEWLSEKGLNAFEYPFGRGVRMKKETGEKIAEHADAFGVCISLHAPYYINLATDDPDRQEKNMGYFFQCAEAARHLNAERIVFHPGACANIDRGRAFAMVCDNLKMVTDRFAEKGYGDLILCPETMGKINQIADLKEVARLCSVADTVIPAIDFGHLHARTLGGIRTEKDYENIIDYLSDNIDEFKVNNMHVHFSRIEYTGAGEKMHRRFSDEGFGPDHEPLMRLFAERNLTPTVICESNGTQADDAAAMKASYDYYIMKKK